MMSEIDLSGAILATDAWKKKPDVYELVRGKTERDLSEMKVEELQQFSEATKEDVFDFLTLDGSVAARDHIGGTAPDRGEGSG